MQNSNKWNNWRYWKTINNFKSKLSLQPGRTSQWRRIRCWWCSWLELTPTRIRNVANSETKTVREGSNKIVFECNALNIDELIKGWWSNCSLRTIIRRYSSKWSRCNPAIDARFIHSNSWRKCSSDRWHQNWRVHAKQEYTTQIKRIRIVECSNFSRLSWLGSKRCTRCNRP